MARQDPVATDPITNYTASINWGDGTALSPGTITQSGGTFIVTGSHTYTTAGTYSLILTLTDKDGGKATFMWTVTVM